ncbi:hypothetical protein KEM55_000824 [Ascosphaera atra]|nr:hypothetical protein KEM55_000824 [Ascosphaera atra]
MQRWPENGFDVTVDMPEIICYRSLEEVLADKEVDVVVVSTPPNTHYPLAKAVLEAKMNVIVEKPFTPTHAEAEELIALAKKQGVFVTVFQNRRWDSDYATLQKLINEGYLGRVVDFETHFDRHRPEAPAAASTWKIERIAGGSALYDLGPHMLDQIYHLFGSPKKITAFIGSQRAVNPTGYEDSFTVRMDYDNGLFATARSNVISPEERQIRFWVRGEAGSYKKVS